MKLWRKATGTLKDQKSIWIASLATRTTSVRHPKIEAAVIKSTSHDELFIDANNIAFIYRLLRLSPSHQRTIIYAISTRLEKTTSWVVALKGLLLMHGIFACKIPFIHKIGRLPFDLSNFRDKHTKNEKTWGYNTFISSYYAFLDSKSEFLYHNIQASHYNGKPSLRQDLVVIQKLQGLLDMLLDIRPQTEQIRAHPLFVEAIDCVVMEVFDVYSQICRGISRVRLRICSVGKMEALIALKIIRKATIQGEELSLYFESCRAMGVMNVPDCLRIHKNSKEAMQDLEDIINGAILQNKHLNEDNHDNHTSKQIVVRDSHQLALINHKNENIEQSKMKMTIITYDWETFDEDFSEYKSEIPKGKNPFQDLMLPALPPPQVCSQYHDLPPLLSL